MPPCRVLWMLPNRLSCMDGGGRSSLCRGSGPGLESDASELLLGGEKKNPPWPNLHLHEKHFCLSFIWLQIYDQTEGAGPSRWAYVQRERVVCLCSCDRGRIHWGAFCRWRLRRQIEQKIRSLSPKNPPKTVECWDAAEEKILITQYWEWEFAGSLVCVSS